jgi:hypothetical protein
VSIQAHLAAALLANPQVEPHLKDQLWREILSTGAGGVNKLATLPGVSKTVIAEFAKNSVVTSDVMSDVVAGITDPEALALVARKRDTKGVRRAVAANWHIDAETASFLTEWAIKHDDRDTLQSLASNPGTDLAGLVERLDQHDTGYTPWNLIITTAARRDRKVLARLRGRFGNHASLIALVAAEVADNAAVIGVDEYFNTIANHEVVGNTTRWNVIAAQLGFGRTTPNFTSGYVELLDAFPALELSTVLGSNGSKRWHLAGMDSYSTKGVMLGDGFDALMAHPRDERFTLLAALAAGYLNLTAEQKIALARLNLVEVDRMLAGAPQNVGPVPPGMITADVSAEIIAHGDPVAVSLLVAHKAVPASLAQTVVDIALARPDVSWSYQELLALVTRDEDFLTLLRRSQWTQTSAWLHRRFPVGPSAALLTELLDNGWGTAFDHVEHHYYNQSVSRQVRDLESVYRWYLGPMVDALAPLTDTAPLDVVLSHCPGLLMREMSLIRDDISPWVSERALTAFGGYPDRINTFLRMAPEWELTVDQLIEMVHLTA